MKIAEIFLIVLGVHSGCFVADICPDEWQRFGESCYVVITRRMTWHDANHTCAESKAKIAVPNTLSEHQYIWDLYVKKVYRQLHQVSLWIGCIDVKLTGWQPCPLHGENGFENWSKNQPDDGIERSGCSNCAVMAKHYESKWDDQPCCTHYFAVCELPVSKKPRFCLQIGPGGRIEFQCLVGHVMKELRADGVVSCGKACRSEPRCRSINLLMEQGSGKMVCQLNNATRHDGAADGDIEATENCHLFDL